MMAFFGFYGFLFSGRLTIGFVVFGLGKAFFFGVSSSATASFALTIFVGGFSSLNEESDED